jgi:PAS domain S-box-containing protein
LLLLAGSLVLSGLVAAAILAFDADAAYRPLALVITGGLALVGVGLASAIAIRRGVAAPAAPTGLPEAATASPPPSPSQAAPCDGEPEVRPFDQALVLATESVERAPQLTASEARLRAFFDNSPDWLILVRATTDGRFICEDLNPAGATAYGAPRDQAIGRQIEEILGAEAAERPLHHLREILRTGAMQRYATQQMTGGQARTVDVTYVQIPGTAETDDHFIATTARDVTERERLEEQLRQAQKMEALGQLTGGVAHDFNNLLTTIVGNLELAQVKRGDPKAVDRAVVKALRAAERGAKLTQQLLAFSRRQHLHEQSIDANELLLRLRDILATTVGGLVRIDIETAEVWPILADSGQLELALLNLAINARDAMPSGGGLAIRTANLETHAKRDGQDSDGPADLGPGNYVRIAFTDTGSGMSEDIRAKAFEPFFTTKEPGKGSGLGLSQVYGFARQSGGTVQLESAVGRGTTVSIFLPRAIGAAAPEPPTRQRIDTGPAGGRILLVDDDEDVRKLAFEVLSEAGYSIIAAKNGFEALDLLAESKAFDLMLVDFAMPGMSGVALYEEARLRCPEMRVLFMTGFAESMKLETLGDDPPIIAKPFRLTDLLTAVADRLAAGRDAAAS